MKKVMSCCCVAALVLSMVMACVPMTAFAAYENTHVNTGDQAADIVAIAETQVGYLEGSLAGTTAGSNNYTKYGVWYDNYFSSSGFSYGAWCAMFVSWCAYQADIPSSTMYYHAYCPYGVDWFKNKGLWKNSAAYGGSYKPQPGDIIYFGSAQDSSSHVGLVRYSDSNYVYTIEGNTSGQNGEVNEGGGCFKKSYSLSYSRIIGYGTPNYEEGTGTSAAKLGTYKITASSLNVRKGAGTSYDIVGTLSNGDLVEVFELSGGWGQVVLSDGTVGWCSIGDYGDYIGVDALNSQITAVWGADNFDYQVAENGAITFNNNNNEPIAVDLPLEYAIGNRTTPYLNMGVSVNKGSWYFGLTKSGTGYFMMRECTSSNQLEVASSATYMITDEWLQIDIGYWWAPEEKYQIDTVRLYLNANSSVTVNYCYFAEEANVVTSEAYNIRKGNGSSDPVVVPDPVNLLKPNTLYIPDRSKAGGYTYANGKLTVVSNNTDGYAVAMDVNQDFTPEELSRWLVSVNANVRFDIELLVTTADGDRTFSLRDDFYYDFAETPDGDYIPAFNGSAGLDILSCYTWNNVLPANGVSTVKTVTFRLGGEGTLVVNGCQLAANDSLTMFTDSVTVSDSTSGVVEPSVEKGDVNGDGDVSTTDARILLVNLLGGSAGSLDLNVADYDGDGDISTTDVRLMLKDLL